MILQEFLFSLVIALILGTIFIFIIHKKATCSGVFCVFFFLFLVTWAGGIWLKPFGPTWKEIYWLPYLLVGLFFVLLLMVFTPKRPPRNRRETLEMLDQIEQEKSMEKITYISVGLFFWVLLAILAAAILVYYLR